MALILAILLFIAFGLWFIYDGWRARSANKTLYHFLLKSGTLEEPGFFGSILSTNLSIGNFLVFVAGWGFLYGWGGIVWFVINLCMNFVFFAWYLPVFTKYIEEPRNCGSIHEYLALAYSANNPNVARAIRLTASAATVLGLLFALALELHLAAVLLGTVWPVQPAMVVSVLTILICCYAAFGGFQTVVTTDTVQAGLLLLGTALLVGALWPFLPQLPPFAVQSVLGTGTDLGVPSIVGIVVVGSGWFLVAMDNWQRMSATRSHQKTLRAFGLYTVAAVVFGIAYGVFGMIDATAVGALLEPPSGYAVGANVLSDLLLFGLQGGLGTITLAVVAVTFIIAAVSTADTFLIVCGHSITTDILLGATEQRSLHDLTEEGEGYYVTVSRALVIGMGVFVLMIWFGLAFFGLLSDPLTFFFIAYSVQYALFAPVLFTRLQRLRPGAYFGAASVLLGLLVAIISGFLFWTLAAQSPDAVFFGLSYIDWLYLTPVTTTAAGSLVLLLGLLRRLTWNQKHSSLSGS